MSKARSLLRLVLVLLAKSTKGKAQRHLRSISKKARLKDKLVVQDA
jgi:hypothetical protein